MEVRIPALLDRMHLSNRRIGKRPTEAPQHSSSVHYSGVYHGSAKLATRKALNLADSVMDHTRD